MMTVSVANNNEEQQSTTTSRKASNPTDSELVKDLSDDQKLNSCYTTTSQQDSEQLMVTAHLQGIRNQLSESFNFQDNQQ